MLADAIADPAAFVDGLGKWAQFEANHAPLQPKTGRADDLIEVDGLILADWFVLTNERIPVQPPPLGELSSSMLILRFMHVRLPPMPARIPATLIPGDGIGPEIMDATLAALDALGAPFQWDRQVAGLEGVKAAGDPLPSGTIDSIRRTRLGLKGPLETPSGGGYRSSNVRLRTAIGETLNADRVRTGDLGGDATTAQFTRALIKRVENAPNHLD